MKTVLGYLSNIVKKISLFFLDELKDFDIQKLFDMKGMGIGKINAIIKKYDEAIGENNSQLFNTRSRILFDEINPELYDVSIEIIGVLGISSKWISILKNTGYITVGQLEKIDVNVFSKIVGMRNIDKFRKMESKLKLSLIKLCCYVFDKNKEEKDYLMALERSFGFTLQEIADERVVTRERIRQITRKYFDKISPLINQIVLNKLEAKEFPNGIKLYESEDLDTLRNLVKKRYGNLGIPDNNRAFTSRLTEYLVLCGRGMFTAVENINIEIETIEKIKKFIDERKESVVFLYRIIYPI